MRLHIPFELIGPQMVHGAFYKTLSQQNTALLGVQSATVKVAALSEITDDLGEVRAGTFITSDLYYSEPDASDITTFEGSGVIISGESFSLDGTNYWNVAGINNGALQFALSADDGAAYAGGGAVVLDSGGISIAPGSGTVNSVKWVSSDAVVATEILGGFNGSTPNRSAVLTLNSYAEVSGSGDATIQLEADDGGGDVALLQILSDKTAQYAPFKYFWLGGQTGTLHYGDYAGYSTYNNDATVDKAVYTHPIKANSMGSTGHIHPMFAGMISNSTGGPRNGTVKLELGGTLLYSTGAISINNGSNLFYWIDALICNTATNVQFTLYRIHTAVNGGATVSTIGVTGSSIDTTADRDLTVNITLGGAASASLSSHLFALDGLGPYHA